MTSTLYRIFKIVFVNLLIFIFLLYLVDYFFGKTLISEPWMFSIKRVDYYKDKDWTRQLLKDSKRIVPRTAQYSPFVIWRRPPYRSSTINTDSEGRRVTPGNKCNPGAYTIFIFGGSAAWGTGAPDWGTIPAYLHQGLASRFKELCIVNFAESAWNSNQEVIQLTIALRQGLKPNLALFYSGWNDANIALSFGNPFLHEYYSLMSSRVNRKGWEWPLLLRLLTPNLLKAGYLRFLEPKSTQQRMDTKSPEFQEALIANYNHNIQIATALSNSYGFKVHFFWQPDLSRTSRPMHPNELKLKVYPELKTLLQNLVGKVGGSSPNFTDLGGALDQFSEQAYIDHVHITPKANEVISKKMIDILDQLKKFSNTK